MWQWATRVLCVKKILLKVKRKFNMTIIRPRIMYGSKYRAINKKENTNECCKFENIKVDVRRH